MFALCVLVALLMLACALDGMAGLLCLIVFAE